MTIKHIEVAAKKRLLRKTVDSIDHAVTLELREAKLPAKDRKFLQGLKDRQWSMTDRYEYTQLERKMLAKPIGLWVKCKGDPDLLVKALDKLALEPNTRKKIDEFLAKKLGS